MNVVNIKVVILTIMLVLGLLVHPCFASAEDNNNQSFIYVENLTIVLEDGSANISMDYELGVFAKFYLFMLGGRFIEPELESILVDFDEITAMEINQDRAVFLVEGAIHDENGYNVFDSSKLNQEVKNVTIIFSDGSTMKFKDVESIPRIRYKT